MATRTTLAFVVATLFLAVTGTRAETQRSWQSGTWRDANQAIRAMRLAIVPGTADGGCSVIPQGDRSLGAQVCVIEAAERIYVGRRKLNFRGTDLTPTTANRSVKFAIDQQTLYAIGEDGKEYKFELVADAPRPSAPEPHQAP